MSRKDVTNGNLAQDMSDANDNFIELYTAVEAATSGSGVLISGTDTTLGTLMAKLLAGANVTLTQGSIGGNETLTISVDTSLSNDTSPELSEDLDGKKNSIFNAPLKVSNLGTVAIDQTLDASTHNLFVFEPTADITANITNVDAGDVIGMIITGGGDHTFTWQVEGLSNMVWADGEEPSWATTTSSNITAFISPDGTKLAEIGTVEVVI